MSALEPPWLGWVRALNSIAQAGAAFATDAFDLERYGAIRRIAAEIAAERSAGDAQIIEGLFASGSGYPTPKVDVRAAVIAEDHILLVRERDDGGWSLPGGWADVGESAADAAVRETREEAAVEVRAVKLFAFYDRQRRGHPVHPDYSYKAFFSCEPCGKPDPRAGAETDGAGFFARTELPPLSIARVTTAEIDRAFAHHRDPGLPTEFD